MTGVTVAASNARATSTGVTGGLDVDFRCVVDGAELEGEVTLVPDEQDGTTYQAWGSPDNWIDGRTVAALRDLDRDSYRHVLDAIESACSAVAGLVQS
jgi:hypothetical protein